MKRRLITSISMILVVALLLGVLTQRQFIRDMVVAQTASQQIDSVQLKESLELTEEADFLYRASRPQVQSADEFNNSCKNVSHEHSIVLGCYTAQRIYIYDIEDERLNGVKQVTAAHELLHAIYERLSSDEKEQLNTQLTSVAGTIDNQRFKETVEEYRRAEPGQVENELHSILGTEIEVLPTSLEQHYQKYFKNRGKIVAYAQQYEEAFTSLEKDIARYDQQLSRLKQQKEQMESSLASGQQAIEAEKATLERLRSSGDADAYNAAVPGYNNRIQAYNSSVNELKRLVEEYNEVVVKRNALAATQNDLVKQLDSSYTPL